MDECVKKVLLESPYMQMHDLSIEIKGLDADDAWYRMFPKIDLGLSSNIPIGGKNSNGSSFSVTLTSGGYDPISASLAHDAQLDMTILAKYAKLQSASDLLENVVTFYIREAAYAELLDCYDRLIKEARELYAFSAKMYPDAPTVPLEVQLANHRVKQIELEREKLVKTHTTQLARLKRMIDVPAEQRIELAAIDVERDVFQGFNPNTTTFEEVRRNSLQEKMARISAKLAEHNILVAWAKYIPKFSFNVRTPDPVNNSSDDDSYYFTIGMSVPLWHWGELGRGRDRARKQKQKTLLKNKAEVLAWEDQWFYLRSRFQEQVGTEKLAWAEVELRQLQVRKNEILFNTGGVSFVNLTQVEMAKIRKEILAVQIREAKLLAKLKLFFESGKLLNRFIQVEDFENEEE
nr:TolC family protein [uncultured Pseudodesulfovibrio sp.]